ncbi:MAG: TetR/AcrR family transcriptional regulator [Bacillota bacterium]
MSRMSKEARKEQLLAVAAQLFINQGYYETTTKEIAQKAGVSEPIIYRHFSSKHELFFEVIYKVISEAFDNLKVDFHGDLREFLQSFIKLHIENVFLHFNSLKFVLIQLLQDEEVKEYYLKYFVPKMARLFFPYLQNKTVKLNNYSLEFNVLVLGGLLLIFELSKGLFDFTPEGLTIEQLSQRLADVYLKIITNEVG